MVNATATNTYHARMLRVLRYIDEHLDGHLSVEVLSGVAAFSRHHFHRQFSQLFGINVHRYVQLVRLKRAAYRLAFRRDGTITGIALESGYEAPEAFSRAFKQHLGQTPSEFRKKPGWKHWHAALEPLGKARSALMSQDGSFQVEVVDFKETRVAVLEHRGDPALVGQSVRRFIEWRRQVGLHPRHSATFNIVHDDPAGTVPEDFRLDLCAATGSDFTAHGDGIANKVIPGGRCARLRHIGPDDGLGMAVTHLYTWWLPQSGEELRDFPLYFQRVRFFPDVPEHEAVTDIFLPLR